MAKLKCPSAADIAAKWKEVTPGRSGYYEKAASVAGADWESGALAATSTYKAAITAPDIDKRFSGGVKAAGGAKYERKVKAVGVGRFGPGVGAAEEDMKEGMDPYTAVIAGLTVKDRGPRGSATNYEIVKEVGDALHKKRLALLAAGS